MKWKCVHEDISKALLSISKVNTRNSLFPIMELIHIEADDNQITLRATNLEIIIETTINAKVEVKGKMVINYTNISKIINIVKSETLDFELIDNMLYLNGGKSKVKLQTAIYEEMPRLPIIDQNKANKIILNRESFIKSIKEVSFAVANTEIKPEIASIYIYNKNEYLYTVATDTFRLAEFRTNLSNIKSAQNNNEENEGDSSEQSLNMLIPGKNINIILPILDTINDKDIELETYEDGIMINTKDTILAVRTIDGNFPDYTQLFPKEWLGVINLDKVALGANLTATTLFKDNYSYSELSIAGNTMKISTNNNNIGSYESEIDIVNNKLEDKEDFIFEAKYNSSLLLEGLNKTEGNRVKMMFTTSNRAMFIKSESNNDFTYLVMPLLR